MGVKRRSTRQIRQAARPPILYRSDTLLIRRLHPRRRACETLRRAAPSR